jgi:hypothetical protein
MTSEEITALKKRYETVNPLSTPVLILELAFQLAIANELKEKELKLLEEITERI